jgi:predicted NodU family carbamoyl transferase
LRAHPKELRVDVLGIGAWTSPGAASLVRDGRIVAAAREDRFTRRPEDPDFPRQAIEYCLRAGRIGPSALTCVVVAGEPMYPEPRGAARSLLRRVVPGRGGRTDRSPERFVREIVPDAPVRTESAPTAQARAAFVMSGFDEAAVVVFDGDRATIARGSVAATEILEGGVDARDTAALLDRARVLTGCAALAVGGAGAGRGDLVRRVTRSGEFERLWFQPAGAAAAALGSALSGSGRTAAGRPLGPSYNAHEIRTFLRSRQAEAEEIERDDPAAAVAPLLAAGRRVGWFAGRMEFGEEAPASRSILARPGSPPAPDAVLAVPADRAASLFDLDPRVRSPLAPTGTGADAPVVFRVDPEEHRALHALLRAVETEGAPPVLECRPLAAPGEPLACTPRDAFETARRGGLDALVLERYVVRPRP